MARIPATNKSALNKHKEEKLLFTHTVQHNYAVITFKSRRYREYTLENEALVVTLSTCYGTLQIVVLLLLLLLLLLLFWLYKYRFSFFHCTKVLLLLLLLLLKHDKQTCRVL